MSPLSVLLCGLSFAGPRLADDPDVAPDNAGPGRKEDTETVEKAEWDVNAPHGESRAATIRGDRATWMGLSVHGQTYVTDILGDLWVGSLVGGPLKNIRRGPAWDTEARFSPDGSRVVFTSDADGNEQLWIFDVKTGESRQLTHEEEARITDAVWDPSGEWVVARRRTVDTRSIGVTELWQYHVPTGKGQRITSLDQHPHAGEISLDSRYIYFSSRYGRFDYDGNPVAGLWRVVRIDRWTGREQAVVDGVGSAVRPLVHADGRRLLFVSRDRTKTLLEMVDLETGRRKVIWDGLHHDQMEGFALHSNYPRFDWIPGEEAVLVWAQGQLFRVGLGGETQPVAFSFEGTWDFHHVSRPVRKIPDTVRARVIRWPTERPGGKELAFSAMGVLWVRKADGTIARVSPGTGYSPSWSSDGSQLLWTEWKDCSADWSAACGGSLYVTPTKSLARLAPVGPVLAAGPDKLPAGTERIPLEGQLLNPTLSGDGQSLVVMRGRSSMGAPDLGNEGWLEIVSIRREKKGWGKPTVVATTGFRGNPERGTRLWIHADRVYWFEGVPAEGRAPESTVLRSARLDGKDPQEHLRLDGADEVVLSPDLRRVAYKEQHQVWVAAVPPHPLGIKVAELPRRKVTTVVGDWIEFSPDGSRLSWMVGPERQEIRLADLNLLDEAPLPEVRSERVELQGQRRVGGEKVAWTHGTVLTMNGSWEVCSDCTVLVDGGRIRGVTPGGAVPDGYRVEDAKGKVLMPGLIDAHAHLHYTAGDVLPEQEWRYLTALDFGVTTVHDPSAGTDLVFTQAERVAAGMMEGPRVYSTGFVLYGALSNQGARTPDREAARAHVQRLANLGATSVKVYQQSRRDQRQWYAEACRDLGVDCVCEGGGDIWMNLGMVADGMQAVEHALPLAPLSPDVVDFYAASRGLWAKDTEKPTVGTAYTPTLLVAYGGVTGEHWFYQHEDPLKGPVSDRLLRHFPRRMLDARAWRLPLTAHDGDWNHQQVARDAAELARKGVLVTLGAHGQLQGLGVHWELWALAGPGAMSPMEALAAGTIQGARYLGLDTELGSIETGKLADFIVLNADPREDIRNTVQIDHVVHDGRIWR